MLPLQIHVKRYMKDVNYCEAILVSGEKVAFDPFVSCAITLDDTDYEEGKGAETEGKNYLLTSFSVQPWGAHSDYEYHYMVTPNEGGIIVL